MAIPKLTDNGLKELGLRLVAYRESKGWSQREAARQIADAVEDAVKDGITSSALGRIEEGHSTVKVDTLLMLSAIGYGGMTFSEMVDVATEHRLSVCEKPGAYRVKVGGKVLEMK